MGNQRRIRKEEITVVHGSIGRGVDDKGRGQVACDSSSDEMKIKEAENKAVEDTPEIEVC